jgi:hypothetical protein
MSTRQGWTKFEHVGFVFNLPLLAIGIAEIAGEIDLLPVYVYIFLLWILAVSMWLHRR